MTETPIVNTLLQVLFSIIPFFINLLGWGASAFQNSGYNLNILDYLNL